MEYRINGKPIKAPPGGASIEKYKLTKAQRTADGLMNMEFIARKRKFQFEYPVVETKAMKQIEELIFETDDCFFDLSYEEDGEQKKASVYAGALKKTPSWSDGAVTRWIDVSFSLIER